MPYNTFGRLFGGSQIPTAAPRPTTPSPGYMRPGFRGQGPMGRPAMAYQGGLPSLFGPQGASPIQHPIDQAGAAFTQPGMPMPDPRIQQRNMMMDQAQAAQRAQSGAPMDNLAAQQSLAQQAAPAGAPSMPPESLANAQMAARAAAGPAGPPIGGGLLAAQQAQQNMAGQQAAPTMGPNAMQQQQLANLAGSLSRIPPPTP